MHGIPQTTSRYLKHSSWRWRLAWLALAGGFCFAGPSAQAYSSSPRSAEAKAASRWTLDEWLRQKERNRWMDQWLALHSSESYELFTSADWLSRSTESRDLTTQTLTKTVASSVRARVGAYASIVGLEGEYESALERRSSAALGEFHLRLIGTSNQSTHLTLHYGLQFRTEDSESVRLQVPGATLGIYLLKHFGIEGSYRLALPEDSDQGARWKGTRIEGQAFIDYGAIRVFGRYSREQIEVSRPMGVEIERITEGLGAGLQVFF